MIKPVKSEDDISLIVKSDDWMMRVLAAAEEKNLPDWWIGAGFLRNKIWNHMEGKDSEQTRDVDLVYFNSKDTAPETDWAHDEEMTKKYPFADGKYATRLECIM